MADIAASDATAIAPGRLKVDASTLGLGVVLVVTTILKLTVFARQPLTIDEVWTGMIAGQGSLAGLIRECQRDVNGPLAYIIGWLWAHLSGLSNGALRAPSMVFACAAPLIALAPHRLANRSVRYAWATLLACWMPGLIFAEQARCYALVLLLATVNAVTYARLLSRPSVAMAFIWTSVSALFILSHYVAGLLVGCQGIAYLAIHRGKAFKTWPAALMFVPAHGLIGYSPHSGRSPRGVYCLAPDRDLGMCRPYRGPAITPGARANARERSAKGPCLDRGHRAPGDWNLSWHRPDTSDRQSAVHDDFRTGRDVGSGAYGQSPLSCLEGGAGRAGRARLRLGFKLFRHVTVFQPAHRGRNVQLRTGCPGADGLSTPPADLFLGQPDNLRRRRRPA